MEQVDRGASEPVAGLEGAFAAVAANQRRMLTFIARCDRDGVWRADGCYDMAGWLSELFGISNWVAARWVVAAHALEGLPLVAAALEDGVLGLDKVVELARFAHPDTEHRLISWARRVSLATVRRRAELAEHPDLDDARTEDRTRYLRGRWYDGGRSFALQGCWPADQGAVIEDALRHWAEAVPAAAGSGLEGDEDAPAWAGQDADARRADGLFWLASGPGADAPEGRRPVVVVHAGLDALVGQERWCEIEGGPVVHPEVARRLACDAHVEVVVHDESGHAVGIGRLGRVPPAWLVRQLRHRDERCTFAGCDLRRFLHAHHIVPWPLGGRTDLDNLVLVCPFHHKLVHEHGWRVELGHIPGTARWFRPDGTLHEPGPGAPHRARRAPPGEGLDEVA